MILPSLACVPIAAGVADNIVDVRLENGSTPYEGRLEVGGKAHEWAVGVHRAGQLALTPDRMKNAPVGMG